VYNQTTALMQALVGMIVSNMWSVRFMYQMICPDLEYFADTNIKPTERRETEANFSEYRRGFMNTHRRSSVRANQVEAGGGRS
jgi:hypothetical protein